MPEQSRISFAIQGLKQGWLSLEQALRITQLSPYDFGALLARLD